jgi:hypothetical protein
MTTISVLRQTCGKLIKRPALLMINNWNQELSSSTTSYFYGKAGGIAAKACDSCDETALTAAKSTLPKNKLVLEFCHRFVIQALQVVSQTAVFVVGN